MRRSILEHLASNLNGRCCHGDDGAVFVQEFPGEKAYVAATPNNSPSSEQATWPGRPQKLDMQVCRRSEVAGTEAGDQRGAQRVVQHGGEEAALNDAGWVQERLGGIERNHDRSLLRADGNQFPAKCDCGCRERHPAFYRVPERAFAFHGQHLGRGH